MSAPLLSASGLRCVLGGTRVLDGVDLALEPGRLVVVLGPNGAGKTTLVRILSGVLRAEAGQVRLGGRLLDSLSRRDVARALAVVPQELSVPFPFSVQEMVAMGRAPHLGPLGWEGPLDRACVERALSGLGLRPFAARLYSTLSGGEKQRVALARAQAQETDLLLLDEPTAHMDLGHRLRAFEWLRGWIRAAHETRAALVVTHDLILASRFADEILLLDAGRTSARGSPAEVLTPHQIASVYGVVAKVSMDDEGRPVIVAERSRIDYIQESDEPDC